MKSWVTLDVPWMTGMPWEAAPIVAENDMHGWADLLCQPIQWAAQPHTLPSP